MQHCHKTWEKSTKIEVSSCSSLLQQSLFTLKHVGGYAYSHFGVIAVECAIVLTARVKSLFGRHSFVSFGRLAVPV